MREKSVEIVVIKVLKEKRMERLNILEKEYKDVLERVVSFNILYVVFVVEEEEEEECNNVEVLELKLKKKNWDEVVEKFFYRSNFGEFVFNENVDGIDR